MSRRVLLLGHRGARAHAPENTAAGLRLALEQGADGLEFDVRLLGDATPVLMHDSTVDRTTDGQGLLSEFDRDSIGRLDAGAHFDSAFAGERVPLLDDVLAEHLGRAFLAVEMKEILPDEILDGIGRVAREALGAEIVLASFEAKALERARDVLPALPRALILGSDTPMPPEDLVGYLGLSAVVAREENVDERYVVGCRRAGLALHVYTVNDPDRATELVRIGVEGIISDDPAALRPRIPRPAEDG